MSPRLTILQDLTAQLHQVLPDLRMSRVRPLAQLVVGLLWAESVSLPRIAADVPGDATDPSRERRFRRWLSNHAIDPQAIWQDLLPVLLAHLITQQKVILVFDPTPLDTRASILCFGLVHGHRVLPLAWRIVPQQDGTWERSQDDLMRELMAEIAAQMPATCAVTLVVDRQMGGTAVLDACLAVGWHLVARIKAPRTQPIYWRSGPAAPRQPIWDLVTKPGQHWGGEVQLYPSRGWRPVGLTIWWDKGADGPWILISDRPGGRACAHDYRRRVRCEATYEDCKSRVFHLEATKLSTLERIDRLLLALHLAYWWAMRLGQAAIRQGERHRYDRRDRRELGVVRLGLCSLNATERAGKRIRRFFACRHGQWFVPGLR